MHAATSVRSGAAGIDASQRRQPFDTSNTLDAIQSKSATARVISVLRSRREAIALRELARFARVAPSTAHRVAHRLEERGFARIEAAGQERRVELVRTRTGGRTSVLSNIFSGR